MNIPTNIVSKTDDIFKCMTFLLIKYNNCKQLKLMNDSFKTLLNSEIRSEPWS